MAKRPGSKQGKQTQEFKAALIAQGPGDAWTRLIIPFDVEAAWGTRARVSVIGTINGFAFRSSIFPSGNGTHHMMVNKAMQKGAGAWPPETVTMVLAPDTEPRPVEVPPELKKALVRSRSAKSNFAALPVSHQRAYTEWVGSAKREETRANRAAKAIEMLAAGERLDR